MAYSGPMTNASGTKDKPSAGDPIPHKCAVIEVHVGELKQLFNAIDPSPFRDKDLDPKAEEFIVGWAKELPRDSTLALVVDLDREAGLPDEAAVLRDAIHEFFSQRAQAYGRRLRELFRVGRTSLVIGLVALASAIALGDFLAALMKGSRIGEIVRESLTIGGWVSMWRPLEIFLYDWWPIRNEARLSDRLAAMPVRIRYMNATAPDAWRGDWPAVSPRGERRPVRLNLELSIRQVDLVNGMGVHRRGEMNSNTHLRARIEALQDHTQCGERALPIAADSQHCSHTYPPFRLPSLCVCFFRVGEFLVNLLSSSLRISSSDSSVTHASPALSRSPSLLIFSSC
jgi:hypothetical protein